MRKTLSITALLLLAAPPAHATTLDELASKMLREEAARDSWYWMRRSTDIEDRRWEPWPAQPVTPLRGVLPARTVQQTAPAPPPQIKCYPVVGGVTGRTFYECPQPEDDLAPAPKATPKPRATK
jgi:hypothetical protein